MRWVPEEPETNIPLDTGDHVVTGFVQRALVSGFLPPLWVCQQVGRRRDAGPGQREIISLLSQAVDLKVFRSGWLRG